MDLPFKILEKMEKEWKTLIRLREGRSLRPFRAVSLPVSGVHGELRWNAISTRSTRLLCVLNEVSVLTVKVLEEGIQVVTKTWLAVVE